MHTLVKIILVDDDENLLNSLSDFLEVAAQVESLKLSGLKQVIAAADQVLAADVKLAVLDVNLAAGEASGIDVYRWLLEKGFNGEVVFLTGHAKEHPLVREAVAIGGVRVFSKPLDVAKLLALVEEQRDDRARAG
jgi:FixJ family two-component response regulator